MCMKVIKFVLLLVLIILSFCAGMKYQVDYVDKGIGFSFGDKVNKDKSKSTKQKDINIKTGDNDLFKAKGIETKDDKEIVNFDLLDENDNANLENMPNDNFNSNKANDVNTIVEKTTIKSEIVNNNDDTKSNGLFNSPNPEMETDSADNNTDIENNLTGIKDINSNNNIDNNDAIIKSIETQQELENKLNDVKNNLEKQ